MRRPGHAEGPSSSLFGDERGEASAQVQANDEHDSSDSVGKKRTSEFTGTFELNGEKQEIALGIKSR